MMLCVPNVHHVFQSEIFIFQLDVLRFQKTNIIDRLSQDGGFVQLEKYI